MSKFLTFGYWFNSRAGSLAPTIQKLFIIFIIALLALALIANYKKEKADSRRAKIWGKLFVFGVTNTILGLLLLFFTYEQIPFLSTRILFLVWGIAMATRLYFINKDFKSIPEKKEKCKKREEFEKYIPKPKK